MEAINDKIMSLDYGDYRAEIKTVDSQDSFNQGVLVLVTGALLGKNNIRRNFTQSFFLAPQEKGYFVLNDVFRYLEEPQQLELRSALDNGVSDQAAQPSPSEEAPAQEFQELEQQAPQLEEDSLEEEHVSPSEHGDGLGAEDDASPLKATEVVQNEQHVATETHPSEEMPKKSYASIVKVMAPVQAPAVVRTVPANVERQGPVPPQVPPASESFAPASNASENSNSVESEADGRSVYIKNLPLNATTTQLEEEFKKFGRIKPGGVQVRSNRQQAFCYGFVEFESSSSAQSAIEASPINIDGRQAQVEEKRPTGPRAARGRFQSGRGGYRNDVIRGRGGYGGRGYGRGEFVNRGDFGGRGRGSSSGHGGATEEYQRVDQGGNSTRGARPSGTNQTRNVQRFSSVNR
ncbi:hypothetical protein SUGI_1009760 [Cryptomeria japonica]|nr:hypothetical protein SUGI_1009760 [Cryptomeria japonica]